MKGNESLPWDAVGAAEKLHRLHPVFDILQCHCLAMQLVAKCCQGRSQQLSLPFTAYNTPTECCFKHAQKVIRHIENFYETPSDCSLPAVVIVAASGDKVCADPKKPWVKRALKKLRRKK
uniref:Chemokine interleukin-8-like domain-containing protein n=1 Tax=Accipiter nisus TaxID=211598 RepID=A0A8B9MN44_9AVES